MSAKRLLPLAALLIIVVIAALVLKRQPVPTQLADEAGFERLVPPTLRVDSIRGVDLSLGTQPENVVRLRRQESAWVAASYYNAPVQTEKISAFLTTISSLEGELRTEQSELLRDFHLDDAQALHLRLYTDTFDTPAVHLLAGKGSGRQGFVRRADGTRVYSVNLNVYSEAGVTGDTPEQQLTAKPWLDLHIQNVPKEQITAVALQTPERTLHFASQPSPSAAATPSQENAPPATPAQGHWTLTAPQVTFEPKQGGLDSLVNTLRTLRADDIANPENMAAYGLEQPAYGATLTVQAAGTEARDVSLRVGGAIPEQADKRYSRLDAAGPIYILPAWAFRRLFPPARELLELPHLEIKPADVQRVAWQYGVESWTLEPVAAAAQGGEASQPDTAWRLAEFPEARLDDAAVQAFFAALDQLAADDWLDRPAQPTGLDHPQVELRFMLRDNRIVSLALGQSRGSSDAGYYASLLDHPGTFVVSTTAYTALTEALSKLHPALPPPTPAPIQQ
jgi:uncharacterized protein DUF4340